MSLGLFVGTSFSVGVTEMFLQAGLGGGVPVFSVDPASAPLPLSAGRELASQAPLCQPRCQTDPLNQ